MKGKRERRKLIVCPYCHTQMACMNRFESISELSRGFYAWYICPRRKGEKGCGYTSLVQVFPKTLLPDRTVFSVKFKKPTSRKRAKK